MECGLHKQLNWIIIFPIDMLSLFELPSYISTMLLNTNEGARGGGGVNKKRGGGERANLI